MTRKSRTFGQLLRYMAKPDRSGPPLLHNLRSDPEDLDDIRREFLANSKFLPKRKNGVVLYHEILSFGAEDREQMTPETAEAVVRQYLEIRAPYALAYAQAHFNTNCPHIHVLISANAVASRKRLRLSQQEFDALKRQLNEFVRQQFPQLGHSGRAHQPGSSRLKVGRAEQERRRRGEGKESRKEKVRRLVAAALLTAVSLDDGRERLRRQGLELYRRGKTYGVIDSADSRKYRLRTLGLAEVFEKAQRGWRSPSRPELPAPRRERSREIDRGR